MTWLLIEDEADIRNFVNTVFQMWGETPLAFPDGNAAWNWLDSVENGTYSGALPELALLDIRMPGYTGDQIAARIRRTQAIKDIPIVLMTAFSLTEADVHALRERTGLDALIRKPLPDLDSFQRMLYQIRDSRRTDVGL